jgi:hypothetical protein
MTIESIEKDLRRQIGIITEAAIHVRSGIIMNINEVEHHVASICKRISGLAPEESEQLEPAMAEMIGKLEELAAALTEFQEKNNHGTD